MVAGMDLVKALNDRADHHADEAAGLGAGITPEQKLARYRIYRLDDRIDGCRLLGIHRGSAGREDWERG
jgi:hypothetical protein